MVRLDSESFTDAWHQTLTDDIEYLKHDKCPNVAQVHTIVDDNNKLNRLTLISYFVYY